MLYSPSISRRALTRVACLVLAAAGLVLSACASGPPSSFYSSDYHESQASIVDRAVRGIVVDQYRYTIDEWEVSEDGKSYTFNTEWNYRDAGNAQFSGRGIRRRAYIEIHLRKLDELPEAPIGQPLSGAKAPGEGSQARNPELGNPDERAAIYIAVEQQRNMSVRNPNATDEKYGDWQESAPDHQEAKEILAKLRFRMVSRKHDYNRLGDLGHGDK